MFVDRIASSCARASTCRISVEVCADSATSAEFARITFLRKNPAMIIIRSRLQPARAVILRCVFMDCACSPYVESNAAPNYENGEIIPHKATRSTAYKLQCAEDLPYTVND